MHPNCLLQTFESCVSEETAAATSLSRKQLSRQTERFLSTVENLYPAWQVSEYYPTNGFKRADGLPNPAVARGRGYATCLSNPYSLPQRYHCDTYTAFESNVKRLYSFCLQIF